MPAPAPTPMPAGLPTSADAARALLPGVRIAARERYGRVRMAFLAPFLLVLLQIFGEFLLKFLADWLARADATSPTLLALAGSWERERLPEVRAAMTRVAQGDTGTD